MRKSNNESLNVQCVRDSIQSSRCLTMMKMMTTQHMSKDFQTNFFKLDNVRLRFLRWNQFMKLNDDMKDRHSFYHVLFFVINCRQVESILRQVLKLFVDAKSIAKKFKTNFEVDDTKLSLCDVQANSNQFIAFLYHKMREMFIKRQNQIFLRKKVKWFLYEEKNFKRLMKDIHEKHSRFDLSIDESSFDNSSLIKKIFVILRRSIWAKRKLF